MTFEEHIKFYIKNKKRMCKVYKNECKHCPLTSPFGCNNLDGLLSSFKLVSEWAEAHPEKTYKMDFISKFPNVNSCFFEDSCRCYIYGTPEVTDDEGCPIGIEKCSQCWDAPME